MMGTKHLAAALFASLAASTPALAFDSESITTDGKLSAFESVYIAPVRLALDHDVRGGPRYLGGDRPVREEDAKEKASDLHDDLLNAFEDSFSIAAAPGAGVLTIDATLTRLQSSRPTIADLQEEPGLSMSSRYAGGAAMRIVFSENGSPLAEVGDSYTDTLDNHRISAGIWEDADRAFSSWARQLVAFVRRN